jgi:hypothetical protein
MSELQTSTTDVSTAATAVVAAAAVHYFGIRHHGPGCARSLLKALEQLQPDCVLVEGPPEADDLIAHMVDSEMQPPVALLTYCPDDPHEAVYHPYAEFSPEWQALTWAARAGVTARFIDLPMVHVLAWQKQRRIAREAEHEAEAALAKQEEKSKLDLPRQISDPLDVLAEAAGYTDGEAWWNHWVEERGDGEGVFAAISEAMLVVRQELGDERYEQEDKALQEERREAYMRQCIRAAEKEGYAKIAVICGAWHLAGLQDQSKTVKTDTATLKALPKLKTQTTWVPWTYRHLSMASGYGAGIAAPGWYAHLWQCYSSGKPRSIGWLARVAKLMREHELDCSSAHMIEASRLADALAVMRGHAQPGLTELQEACRTVLMMGDEAPMAFIHDALVVGDRLGNVPSTVPVVPLQRDLEQQQKSLRLKPEALQKTLDLDLRNATDLARSQLLHRLLLLQVQWGQISRVGRSAKGTFHEVWALQWKPEFIVPLIQASALGQTVEQAASRTAIQNSEAAQDLSQLSTLIDQVLLANLPDAIETVAQALHNRAAVTGDVMQLLGAMPALANVFRYGNVRQTDAQIVGHVLDVLILRAAIGLPLAAHALDDAAAEVLRDKLLAADAAVHMRNAPEQLQAWQRAQALLAQDTSAHVLLRGLATRLLLDRGVWSAQEVADALSLQLSYGAEPAQAASWLDGFLNRNAVVLLHDAKVWQLVDEWLTSLSTELFMRILPLVRRSFAAFSASERRDLGVQAARGPRASASSVAVSWDVQRAALVLPLLRQIWKIDV